MIRLSCQKKKEYEEFYRILKKEGSFHKLIGQNHFVNRKAFGEVRKINLRVITAMHNTANVEWKRVISYNNGCLLKLSETIAQCKMSKIGVITLFGEKISLSTYKDFIVEELRDYDIMGESDPVKIHKLINKIKRKAERLALLKR